MVSNAMITSCANGIQSRRLAKWSQDAFYKNNTVSALTLSKGLPWSPRDSLITRTSNQSILKEISPEYSLEGLMLKLKLQYFGHLILRTDSMERPWCWAILKVGGEGDDRMRWLMASLIRWTWVEQALGVGDGQGSLACCSPQGHKESDVAEWLNWTDRAH